MAFLSKFNPVPQFPQYKGPYNVGSFELEIPVSILSATSPEPPEAASSVSTIQFRVFYPTSRKQAAASGASNGSARGNAEERNSVIELEANSNTDKSASFTSWFKSRTLTADKREVYWLPEPHQREYLSGYARLLGAGSGLAELLSYIPRALYHISLPVQPFAPLLPSLGSRYPTMIFSHGLGGTRMAYSYFCASMASSGMIVIAPEHRDGSCPVTFINNPAGGQQDTEIEGEKPTGDEPGVAAPSSTDPTKKAGERVQVNYTAYKHEIDPEVHRGRDRQLETRIWELTLLYTALRRLDSGDLPEHLISMPQSTATERTSLLSQFAQKLDMHAPGRLILAGHSFGSSTMLQFIKSVYYPRSLLPSPLYTATDPTLEAQLTPLTPLLLLDPWCLPTLSHRTHRLFRRPLPQRPDHADRILAIMSHEFINWQTWGVRRILSPDPGRRRGTDAHKNLELWDDDEDPPFSPPKVSGEKMPGLWYVQDSAHMSQSDFPVLFPRVAGWKARDHEDVLDINVKATVGWLRELGYAVEMEGVGELGERWKRVGLGDGEEGVEQFGKW